MKEEKEYIAGCQLPYFGSSADTNNESRVSIKYLTADGENYYSRM